MARLPAYYTLCALYDGVWSAQFGDYEKAVVLEEQEEWAESEPETQTCIVKSEDSQSSIDAKIAALNINLCTLRSSVL